MTAVSLWDVKLWQDSTFSINGVIKEIVSLLKNEVYRRVQSMTCIPVNIDIKNAAYTFSRYLMQLFQVLQQ